MSQLSQAIITPTCQANRGRVGSWEEAVERLWKFYDDVSLAWPVDNQPTFTLTLDMQRPAAPLSAPKESE